MIQPGRRIEFPDESSEVVARPETTGDRYRVIGTTPPGGGTGIRGTGPHLHPGLIEIFRCVSNTMTVRVGKDLVEASPSDAVEVPAGTVHGFVNTGTVPLVTEVDLISTPPGPRPQADLIVFAVILDGLIRDGQVSKRTGLPPISQQALLLRRRFQEAMDHPGIGRLMMRPSPRWAVSAATRSTIPSTSADHAPQSGLQGTCSARTQVRDKGV